MAKFSVTYTRLVRTIPYENITISLTREFDEDEVSHDYAFKEVRDTVARWIDVELQSLGLKARVQ
jgi:hypothetical protein